VKIKTLYKLLKHNDSSTTIMNRRKLDISIISDAHLGSYACHARELLRYLKSISPDILILNGDFVNPDKVRKNQLPEEHNWIIQEVIQMTSTGTKVYYVNQNQEKIEQYLTAFTNRQIHFRESLELYLKGKKYWIFHGASVAAQLNLPFVMKPGGKFYSLLLHGNRTIKQWRQRLIGQQYSQNGLVHRGMKKSMQLIKSFEDRVVKLAQQKGYDYIVCGHIHEPAIKKVGKESQTVTYMNAGDWVENLTALEYRFSKWKLYHYDDLDYDLINPKLSVKPKKKKSKPKGYIRSKDFGSIVEPKSLKNNKRIEEKEFRNGTSDIR